jgi:hypothetical protein
MTFLHGTTQTTDSSGDECATAADVSPNNFVVVTTTHGHQRVFHAHRQISKVSAVGL